VLALLLALRWLVGGQVAGIAALRVGVSLTLADRRWKYLAAQQ
jgi:hypothetical protein